MKKFFIYVTRPEQEFNVFGHELFYEDGMLCCADPVIAIPCEIGDTYIATVMADEYGEEQFSVTEMSAPKTLNSLVAWLCGFSSSRRCPIWRYKYMRRNFSAHAHHPTENTIIDERVINGKLHLAVVRYTDAELPYTRLWAGIGEEPMDAEEILSLADLFVHRVRSEWVVIKLRQLGVDIDIADLRAARWGKDGKKDGESK